MHNSKREENGKYSSLFTTDKWSEKRKEFIDICGIFFVLCEPRIIRALQDFKQKSFYKIYATRAKSAEEMIYQCTKKSPS
ncbi:MAG: hypothetical protein ACPLPS_06055, partial [bacterium]